VNVKVLVFSNKFPVKSFQELSLSMEFAFLLVNASNTLPYLITPSFALQNPVLMVSFLRSTTAIVKL